jgi:hypothetical protein
MTHQDRDAFGEAPLAALRPLEPSWFFALDVAELFVDRRVNANSTACAGLAGVNIVSACVMLSPLAAFNGIRARLKHLRGKQQEISTESQGKGKILSQRDTRAIVWGRGRPAPCPGEHGLEHSRRQTVLRLCSTEPIPQSLNPVRECLIPLLLR